MRKIISVILLFCIWAPHALADDPLASLSAKSLLLMEADTGSVLYEKNPDEKLPIASVTKIMTMLLIMEAIDEGKITLDDMVTVSERAMSMGGSTMFLETGEELSVSDMLKGIAVASANDGAVAMAEHIAGSEEAFVEKMNQRAKELGMENTNFVNTNGLDDDNHYSCARDVALMSKELVKHEKIFEYTTIWMDSLRDGKFELANTNKLIRFYSGANGLKTGSTSKALCCLSATAKRNDMQLIAVVLGAPTSKERFAAASGLLDYGFANYSVNKALNAGEEVLKVPILKGKEKTELSVAGEKSCSILLPKGKQNEIERKEEIPENVVAPIKKGDVIGKIDFLVDGNIMDSVNLVANEDIEKKGYFDFLTDTLKSWLVCA